MLIASHVKRIQQTQMIRQYKTVLMEKEMECQKLVNQAQGYKDRFLGTLYAMYPPPLNNL